VRAEVKYDAIGSFEPAINGANAQFFRGGDVIDTRVRAGVSLDVREQTAYGTLRAYLLGGWQYTSNDAPTLSLPGTAVPTAGGAATAGATPNGNNNLYFARAFIQYGGFTFGKAVSAFDFFDTARYSLQTNFAYQDLGRFGINTFTYTAQLGNGFTASLGFDDGSFYERPIKDLNAAPPAGVIAGFGTFRSSPPGALPIVRGTMPASSCRISPAMCGSIRRGARRRSWARCTTIARAITTRPPTA
jgi:hypothetical protein